MACRLMREDCSNCNFLYDLFPVSSNYCLVFPVLFCVIYCMHLSLCQLFTLFSTLLFSSHSMFSHAFCVCVTKSVFLS